LKRSDAGVGSSLENPQTFDTFLLQKVTPFYALT